MLIYSKEIITYKYERINDSFELTRIGIQLHWINNLLKNQYNRILNT